MAVLQIEMIMKWLCSGMNKITIFFEFSITIRVFSVHILICLIPYVGFSSLWVLYWSVFNYLTLWLFYCVSSVLLECVGLIWLSACLHCTIASVIVLAWIRPLLVQSNNIFFSFIYTSNHYTEGWAC